MEKQANYSIHIVDDDPILAATLEKVSQGFGAVHISATSSDALEMARRYPPDFIFVDIYLPDKNGFSLIQKLREQQLDNHAFIVVITSSTNENDHIDAIKSGVNAFFTKPISQHSVTALLSLLKERQINRPQDVLKHRTELGQVINVLSDVVIVSDEQGVIKSVNQYGLNLFGYKKEELVGANVKVLTPPDIRVHHDEYMAEYKRTHLAKLIGNPRELKAVTKSGHEIHIELNLSEYWFDNEKMYIGIIRDLTDKKKLENKILESVLVDSLTGLKTVYALNADLEKLQQTELQDGQVVAGLIDVDDMQKINSVFGYEAGDALLSTLASKLNHVARLNGAEVYRISADRFVIATISMAKEKAANARRILKSSCQLVLDELTDTIDFPVSFTAVCLNIDTFQIDKNTFIKSLEMSLISARHAGHRGQLTQASLLELKYAEEIDALTMKLKAGIDERFLDIALQPKVNKALQISSCEALLRWRDPSFEYLNLADFIAIAESTGAIIDVGHFVLKRVCEFLAQLSPPERIETFINLSLRQLSDPTLITCVIDYCQQYGLAHSNLGFEVTESLISDDIDYVGMRLMEFNHAGFELAVDDFGTGQSNLRYVHRLPVNFIKVDKSFVDDITSETQTYPAVDSVISMAAIMQRKTVAEGVETATQARYLWDKGVNEIQGYFYYKPMPVGELLGLLKADMTKA